MHKTQSRPDFDSAPRIPKKANASVDVQVTSFSELFSNSEFPLAIDTYQRGFVWDESKIRQLVDDLASHLKSPAPRPPYYMGTILLHRHSEKERLYIIDGQQRVTALSLLHHQLLKQLPPNCRMAYSAKSAKNIVRASGIFETSASALTTKIFEQLQFTVVTVDSVDLAFTFFDTQNNRGVPLESTDLLKAYHLRAIDGCSRERLQTLCASRWEEIQNSKQLHRSEEDFAPTLFSKFLWRARTWKGNQVRFESHDTLIEEFQDNSSPIEGNKDTLPLYRARNNRLGDAITLHEEGYREIKACPIALGNDSADLPFAIRQPVHKGVGFFLYADKYAGLLHRLLHQASTNADILAFRRHYDEVVQLNSLFLKDAYLLASLMYFDQFGSESLFEFALWLDHGLGSLRIAKQSIYMQAAKNYFNYTDKRTFNLLDVIAHSYRPCEVTQALRSDPLSRDVYQKEEVNDDGVRGRYKDAVLTYFGEAGSLRERGSWITEAFIQSKKQEVKP